VRKYIVRIKIVNGSVSALWMRMSARWRSKRPSCFTIRKYGMASATAGMRRLAVTK
jgi:hypothetical protein